LAILLLTACASDEAASNAPPDANSNVAAELEAPYAGDMMADREEPTANVGPARGALYHLADVADPTTLELSSDGSFRWVTNGCDFVGGDKGLWITEDATVVLLPRAGKAQFRWHAGREGIRQRARVVLRSSGDGFQADSGLADALQSWLPGARCPQCSASNPQPNGGLQLGPVGSTACAEPASWWIYEGD
jgi:hypothetical protein